MGSEISVILFDFGGVVVPQAGLEHVAERERALGLPESTLQTAMYDSDLWKSVSVGHLSEDQYWSGLAATLQRDEQTLREALGSIWEPADVDLEVVALARELQQAYRVALLSNATLSLEAQILSFDLDGLFDPVINSARVGMRKPDREIYEHVVAVLDVPAEQVLFIDDRTRNADAAAEMGIQTIVFESGAQLRTALTERGIWPRSMS